MLLNQDWARYRHAISLIFIQLRQRQNPKTVPLNGQILKSFMHTKKQSTRTNRKIRKNAIDKRTILSICAAVFLMVVIVVLYIVFRGPSEVITNGSSKKAEEPESVDKPAVPIAVEGFQAAVAKAKLSWNLTIIKIS